MKAYAVRIHETGGPQVLRYERLAVGPPGPGEALVRHRAVGLNYIDVYHRTGRYPLGALPAVLGMEAAGVVEAVGQGVTSVTPGDRVAYATEPVGAYAQARVMGADRLLRIPYGVSEEQAAAMMLKGMTVEYLIRRTYRVRPGEFVLFHAAAGGVGLIACQWLNHLGATVIGTVGSTEKAELARAHGCRYPVEYRREDFVERVRTITGGAGVPVVYDSVGKETFLQSLDCLAPLGTLVCFGNSSGAVVAFDPTLLAQKGSLFLTRPTLMTYTATREQLATSADALFDVVTSGAVKINIGQSYPLAEVAQAHRDLEARRTRGSTVLLP